MWDAIYKFHGSNSRKYEKKGNRRWAPKGGHSFSNNERNYSLSLGGSKLRENYNLETVEV